VRTRLISAALVIAILVALSTYLAAAQHHGTPPSGDYAPRRVPEWHLTGPHAEQRRLATLARAAWRLSPGDISLPGHGEPLATLAGDIRECRFLNDPPSGTTAKFNCVLNGGVVIKVKYGRNPEIQGEVAGTRLLRALGFPADDVAIVHRLRCYGCPRDPFVTVVASTWTYTRELLGPAGFDDGFTDFEWVSVERRFPAPAIETDTTKGWAWWEVRDATLHRADLDALRLLAVFLAHWDNKTENQRLVCLDGLPSEPAPDCQRPLGMIQDLGATFGPTKVNIGRWTAQPIWDDRSTCRVSMRALPWHGGTFPDAQISEAGRQQLADGLAALTDDQLRGIFRAARFPEFQTATDDERDMKQWVDAFKSRVREIVDRAPCPS
jgi:hypothetical protein